MSEMKALHKSLLLACDLFRGKVDSSSYKDYIFSMLLLKYISDKEVYVLGHKIERNMETLEG